MTQEVTAPTQDERVMAALAHGSILLGIFTSGIGGIVTALVIWLVQKDKSRYVAFQALQSLVYQAGSMVLMILSWCCWFALLMALMFVPLSMNPEAYEATPPAGMWVAMALMFVPFAVWGLFILYGLWATIRTFDGRDFEYLIIGRWLRASSK